jgi:ATP-dependent Lhr-like helicase
MLLSQAEDRVLQWFSAQGWEAFDFQRKVWSDFAGGRSGLIHSATGTGKTYAAWMAPLISALAEGEVCPKGLRVLWITPLRALAADTAAALHYPLEDLGLQWTVETRTGDTSSAIKTKQRDRLPNALVTTPESLSLLLSREDGEDLFRGLQGIIVDEWHELMSTKRGVQTELALARLRHWNPQVRTWGISATLGNLHEAMETLLGTAQPSLQGSLVQGDIPKEVIIDTLLPETIERFPWAGHLGTRMLPQVIAAIEESNSVLLFTNTRSQTEIWFRAILDARPDWKGTVELHHGSLDREVRDAVEQGIKTGLLRAVVCTSSLDLGVDFTPVDRVMQIGSPKGVARLLQRAGRSGHQPGVPSRVTCVPTFALELIDVAAIRDAAHAGRIEQRPPVERPLDVLAQHLVTVALGGGFIQHELLKEVRTTRSYQGLTDAEWVWVLDFVTRGGEALRAYDEYQRVVERGGRFVVEDKHIARRHRMSIGTITSDSAMTIQYMGGHRLGTVEESFIARLNPGDKFMFSGKPLLFVRTKEMTAYVKPARSTKGAIPRWMGGRLPLSTELAIAVREKLEEAASGVIDSPEMSTVAPLLELQARWSHIPASDELLIERTSTREGHHLFLYPIEGRLVHEGLAALFAYRISRVQKITFTVACNDYGIELLSPDLADLDQAVERGLFTLSFMPIEPDQNTLLDDIAASLNAAEMARRQFREIARIAGLIFQGFPGSHKSVRQIQASSSLFYDVFARFDPGNMLLHQANREVLERQLEQSRLARTLERLGQARLVVREVEKPTPLAFPILVDRLRHTVTSETMPERIAKMSMRLEKEAGPV